MVARDERANDREALLAKRPLRKSRGCAMKVMESDLGRSRLAPRPESRQTPAAGSITRAPLVQLGFDTRDRMGVARLAR